MKRHMPPLNHLRALEAAIRHESFTKAAEELNVTQGAISRHVKALEDYLGFTLIERINNNLVIPPESQQLAQALTRAFDAISKAARDLQEGKLRRVIRVHSYTNLMLRWLIPKLPSFQALHPDIEVRISTGIKEVDFGKDDVDVAVRLGLGDWPDARAELLFNDELLPVCSPRLLSAQGLTRPQDLQMATVYHNYARREEWPRWFQLATGKALHPQNPIYLEDPVVVHQCLIAGMGVGLAQRPYVIQDVSEGRLVVLFPTTLRNDGGFYLVCPREGPRKASVATFWDWLLQTARAE